MNSKVIFLITFSICLFLFSCKKGKFPNVNSLEGNYLVSGSYSFWTAYHNTDTTFAVVNDTLFITQTDNSTIHVKAIYNSYYQYYWANTDISYNTGESNSSYYCFDTSNIDNRYTLHFSRSHPDSVYAYLYSGGLGAGGGYTFAGVRIH